MNRPIWYKHSLSPLETPELQEVLLSKTTQLSQGKNVLVSPASNNMGFFSDIQGFLQFS
jgi:hypothetical protein